MSYNISIGDLVIILHGSWKCTIGLTIDLINGLLIVRTISKRIIVRSCSVKSLRSLESCL
ncbi:MAG: hypothetical protein ACTS41_00300 [Candidatus Hodgkinia cicadicola]